MKMTEYQRALVEENMDLVGLVMRKTVGTTDDPMLSHDDLFQVGCEALCKAAMKYVPQKSLFRTFAPVVIRNALFDYCRHMNVRSKRLASYTSEGEVFDILSVIVSSDSTRMITDVDSSDAMELFKQRKEEFAGVARAGMEAIELKMYGYTVKEIAEMNHTTTNNVCAWISRARSKLKNDTQLLSALA